MVTFNIYVHKKNHVDGTSMEPTLQDSQSVYTTMLPYIFGEPEIGDIVVIDIDIKENDSTYFRLFKQTLSGKSDTFWIKRIVGLPGDQIAFKNKQFYRNGKLVEEDYIKEQNVYTYPVDITFTVPEEHVYVMGDNRNLSKDSRDATVGPIPIYKIIGYMWKTA